MAKSVQWLDGSSVRTDCFRAFESQPRPKGWIVQYPIGYMGIGAILDTAVKVLKDNFVLLLSISGVTIIPAN